MTGFQLFDALSQVDEKYLSPEGPDRKAGFRNKWVILAASMALMVLAGFTAKLISGWEITAPPSSESGTAMLRYSVGSYPLSPEAAALVESHLKETDCWEGFANNAEEVESLLGIHLLTVPDSVLIEGKDFQFLAERSEKEDYVLGGSYWQQGWQQLPEKDEHELQWTMSLTALLHTVGGTKELEPYPVPEGYFSIQRIVHLDGLNIDANLYFHAVDLNLYANVITQEARPYGIIRHNSVYFFFTHNEIAYTGFISVAFGDEIQAEEAFERAAEILSRLR